MPQRSSPKSLHHNEDPNLHNRSNDVAADASDGLWQYFHLLGGVAYTLLFSLAGCYVSVQVVNSISSRHALDGDAAILACLVGSVALGLSTTSILSQLSPPSQRRSDSTDEGASVHDATLVVGSLLSSALAMAVGMAIVPGLATEAFGVRVALVRGVLGAAFVALGVFVKWIGWLDKPERRVIPLQTPSRR